MALQHCHWTVERFATMKDMNPLAKSAIGVLRAVVARLVKAIGNCAPPSSISASADTLRNASDTPLSTTRTLGSTPASSIGRGSIGRSSAEGSVKVSSELVSPAVAAPSTGDDGSAAFSSMMPGGWEMPQDGNGFPGIAPFFAMGDLIYKELTVDQDEEVALKTDTEMLGDDSFLWQFEGGFGQDTVWQLFNQHQPGSNETG